MRRVIYLKQGDDAPDRPFFEDIIFDTCFIDYLSKNNYKLVLTIEKLKKGGTYE